MGKSTLARDVAVRTCGAKLVARGHIESGVTVEGIRPGDVAILDDVDGIEVSLVHAVADRVRLAGAIFLYTARRSLGLPGEQIERVEEEDADSVSALDHWRRVARWVPPRRLRMLTGGNPFAIELAALALPTLGVGGVVLALERHPEVLRHPKDGATIASILAPSLSNLSGAALSALGAASIFAGPFQEEDFDIARAPGPTPVAALIAAGLIQQTADGLRVPAVVRLFGRSLLLRDGHDRAPIARIARAWAADARDAVEHADGPSGTVALGWLSVHEWTLEQCAEERIATALQGDAEAARDAVAFTRAVDRIRATYVSGERLGLLSRVLGIGSLSANERVDLLLACADAQRGVVTTGERHATLELARELSPEVDPVRRAEIQAADALIRLDAGSTVEARTALKAIHRELQALVAPAAAARVNVQLASALLVEGRMGESRAVLEESVAELEALGARRWQALALANLAATWAHVGDPARASVFGDHARRLCIDLREHRVHAVVLQNLAYAAQSRGDADAAEALSAEALAVCERCDERRYLVAILAQRALFAHDRGEWAASHAFATRALELSVEQSMRLLEACLEGIVAMVCACRGDEDAANAGFASARAKMPDQRSRYALLLDIWEAEAKVARARHGGGRGAGGKARTLRTEAAAVLGAALGANVGEDVRFALRGLRRRLMADGHDLGEVASAFAPMRAPMDGSFIAIGDERIDFARRPSLAKVMSALVVARVSTPGTRLTVAALCATLWPDEAFDAGIARRLYTLVAELRRRGLRQHLVGDRNGYALTTVAEIGVLDGE